MRNVGYFIGGSLLQGAIIFMKLAVSANWSGRYLMSQLGMVHFCVILSLENEHLRNFILLSPLDVKYLVF